MRKSSVTQRARKPKQLESGRIDDEKLPFTEHLGELRMRLLYSVIAIVLLFFVAFAYHTELFLILK